MTIETKKLGLAAYIKMGGAKLLRCKDKKFIFESEKTRDDWEISYLNSCCYKHDTEVINLRRLSRS